MAATEIYDKHKAGPDQIRSDPDDRYTRMIGADEPEGLGAPILAPADRRYAQLRIPDLFRDLKHSWLSIECLFLPKDLLCNLCQLVDVIVSLEECVPDVFRHCIQPIHLENCLLYTSPSPRDS